MDKREFFDRFLLAGERARDLASNLSGIELPEKLCYTIDARGSQQGRQILGMVKFLGGRFLEIKELQHLPPRRAASLLWVDGKVPAWINVQVTGCTAEQTELFIRFCGTLVAANENRLSPDWGYEKGNELAPFRIRGSSDLEIQD